MIGAKKEPARGRLKSLIHHFTAWITYPSSEQRRRHVKTYAVDPHDWTLEPTIRWKGCLK